MSDKPSPDIGLYSGLEPRLKTLILTLKGTGERRQLDAGSLKVGRAKKNDWVLADPAISKWHCRFDVGPQGAMITDLGSTNGTRVSGRLLVPFTPTPLHGGEIIEIGTLHIKAELMGHTRTYGAPQGSFAPDAAQEQQAPETEVDVAYMFPGPPQSEAKEAPARFRRERLPAGTEHTGAVKVPRKDASEKKYGLVLWNMPERMRVGRSERVEVRLGDADVNETLLRAGLRGRGQPKIDNLIISRLMRVTLVGDEKDFSIKALSSLDQYIEKSNVARWDFLATPLRAGRRVLRILISIRLRVEGKDEVYDLPSYEREVHIVVAPLYTFGQFIARNWQWVAATIIIPLIVWVAADSHRAANVLRNLIVSGHF